MPARARARPETIASPEAYRRSARARTVAPLLVSTPAGRARADEDARAIEERAADVQVVRGEHGRVALPPRWWRNKASSSPTPARGCGRPGRQHRVHHDVPRADRDVGPGHAVHALRRGGGVEAVKDLRITGELDARHPLVATHGPEVQHFPRSAQVLRAEEVGHVGGDIDLVSIMRIDTGSEERPAPTHAARNEALGQNPITHFRPRQSHDCRPPEAPSSNTSTPHAITPTHPKSY